MDKKERNEIRMRIAEEASQRVIEANREARASSPCDHKEEEYCNCHCHDPIQEEVVRHLVPCCITCTMCGQRLEV